MRAPRGWRALLWLAAIGLLLWVLRSVDFTATWELVRGLERWEVATLVVVNIGALFVFGIRWWIILDGLGHPLGFLQLCLYRFAAFGFAYFTPGPLIGGEPVQVILAEKRHGLPREVAIASVGLDRLFEGVVHLGFLAAAALMVTTGRSALFLAVFVSVPLAYLVALASGRKPLSALVRREVVRTSEAYAGRFCRERPKHVVLALVASGLSWSLVVLEYSLVVSFLGAGLDFRQVLVGWVASRIAYLLFLPAGLGVLEASQVVVFRNLGLAAEMAVGVVLVVRFRDVVFSGIGLLVGMRMLTSSSTRPR